MLRDWIILVNYRIGEDLFNFSLMKMFSWAGRQMSLTLGSFQIQSGYLGATTS